MNIGFIEVNGENGRCKLCGAYSRGIIKVRDSGLNKGIPVAYCIHSGQLGRVVDLEDFKFNRIVLP